MMEITRFSKSNGPLSKRIALQPDGTIKSDGSACIMAHGFAYRVVLATLADLGNLIVRFQNNEALALGALRPGLPNRVEIVTKAKLNGTASPNVVARTAANIIYPDGEGLVLIDFDTKGMPDAVRNRLRTLGGCWRALISVLPELHQTARIIRRSTSTGLFRTDTGTMLPGSEGLHIYVLIRICGDSDRFLRTLHDRCWLAGFGWMMVGAGGQLLDRSIVDRMVGAPERLVFEAPPVLDAPLQQDQQSRRPEVFAGNTLDTLAACPPLTILEKTRLKDLHASAAYRLAGESAKARAAFIAEHAARIAARTGLSAAAAAAIVTRQCNGVLLPDVVLPFDDEDLAGMTVADVLADPDRFEGATLADPLEGAEYGTCKARIMRRADGAMWIHSFAHGRTTYELRLDARAVRKAIEAAGDNAVIETFVKLALTADLNEAETEELRNIAADRTGIAKRTINRTLKEARQKKAEQDDEERSKRLRAQRRDPRPQINVPALDAPWLPQMQVINEVLAESPDAVPPLRDIDGFITQSRMRRVPSMHMHVADGEKSLPAPEQWLLTRLDEMQVAELIERHIDFIDSNGQSVHLPMPFVRHYQQRHDLVLPTVVAIATLPIVLPDGGTLAKSEGFDRGRGIIFHIPKELMRTLPSRCECTPAAVKKAFEFLTADWLGDVATDRAGKCTLIAAALTIVERSLLPDRPAFFVTAGRRGGGKTTTLAMITTAAMGQRPAAAAWSSNEEERRKALLSYFLEGVAYIIWDNIARGTQISCPHIEKSCTAAYYSDRRLGVSEMVATAASTIHLFTGNNIGPRGDLASRSLQLRLETERTDPENRTFTHPSPIEWTERNRGAILHALYTIMLGNPMLAKPADAAAKTRFKLWWRIIGSAVEHAAKLANANAKEPLDFGKLFLDQEDDDEDAAALAEALDTMDKQWPATQFKASHVADCVNDRNIANTAGTKLRDFFFPNAAPNHVATAKSVGKRLKAHVDEPVECGENTFILKAVPGQNREVSYFVSVRQGPNQ